MKTGKDLCGIIKPTAEVIKAFDMVHTEHPDITIVLFGINGIWIYMDSDYYPPTFNNCLNADILQDAFDSLNNLPVMFQLPE